MTSLRVILAAVSLKALLDTAAALAPVALALFAGVQLALAARDRRDRKRAAFARLQAEDLRVGSLSDSLAREDLLEWVWQRALRVDDLLPRDLGGVLRSLGEVGAETAALGVLAYEALNDSTVRLRMLVNALEPLRERMAGPPNTQPLRAFETQVKNGLQHAAAVLENAARKAPRWLRQKKSLRIHDAQSELGKALQRQLAGEASGREGEQMNGPAPVQWNEEEWLRVHYGMAHDDIWWVKGHQMKVGNGHCSCWPPWWASAS
jgi:hypothetical protein